MWWLALLGFLAWCCIAWREVPEDPFDVDCPDSAPPVPDGMECPTDPPTEEDLKSLPGRLE